MKVAAIIARVLVGLVFTVFGLNGFLHFIPTPPIPGVAGVFLGAMFSSGYIYLVSATQVVAGVLLLSGQYVPLALALLAPMLANILAFHLTMQHGGLPIPIFVTLLWIFLVYCYRSYFAPLLVRQAAIDPATPAAGRLGRDGAVLP